MDEIGLMIVIIVAGNITNGPFSLFMIIKHQIMCFYKKFKASNLHKITCEIIVKLLFSVTICFVRY